MSSPVLPDGIEHRKCCLCGREFPVFEHLTAGRLEKLNRKYGELAATAIHCICPNCIETHRPKIKKVSGDKVIIKRWDPLKGMIRLFIFLALISVISLVYSLMANLFSLRNLPFNFYISIHIIIVVLSCLFKAFRSTVKDLFKPPWGGLIVLIIIISSITFFVPSFRHIFYSYLPTMNWKVVITIGFIITLCLEIQLIQICLSRLFSRYRNSLLNQGLTFFGIIILFSFVSPFYFGVIKMNPRVERTIRSETVDNVYEERFPTEKEAPREAARRYFVKGKQHAAKGNRTGFAKSIQQYKRALELIPNFSSVYAEMAYSNISIAKILEEAGAEKRKIEENLKKAEEAIKQAKKVNQQNPTVFAVDLLVQCIIAKFYILHKHSHDQVHEWAKIEWVKGDGLKKLRKLAQGVRSTDKVYLAEAILTEDRMKKGSSLLTIIEKLDSDNAEVHNLLGLVYYLVNNKESARRMFERAKRLSPEFGKPYLNLALVYSKKETPRLYKEASTKDNDLRPLAEYYSNLFKNMRRLRWFYVSLVIVWFFGGIVFGQRYLPKNSHGAIDLEAYEKNLTDIQKEIQRGTRKFTLSLLLLFIGTYITFETWIHLIKPINGLSHMFPVGYPFF